MNNQQTAVCNVTPNIGQTAEWSQLLHLRQYGKDSSHNVNSVKKVQEKLFKYFCFLCSVWITARTKSTPYITHKK